VFLIVTCVPAFASSPVQQVSGELTYNLYDGRTSRIQKSEIGHFTVLRTDEKFQFRVFDPSTTPKRLWRTVLATQDGLKNDVPLFKGYLSIGDSLQFALTISRDKNIVAHSLLRVGESFSGYRVESFDDKIETLIISDESGRHYELRLPHSRVVGVSQSKAQIAKAKALEEIEKYRKAAIRRFGTANVVVDLDGSLLPESRKVNYEKHQSEAAKKGMLFFPVSVDGKWQNIFEPKDGKRPDQKTLTDLSLQDAEEIRLFWEVAQAEAGALYLSVPARSQRKAVNSAKE